MDRSTSGEPKRHSAGANGEAWARPTVSKVAAGTAEVGGDTLVDGPGVNS